MLQQWNIRSRAHHCAVSERPFEDGERHFTAIYLDSQTGEYTRRDIAADAWVDETKERVPFSFWRSVYEKSSPTQKTEMSPREGAMVMLQRLTEEADPLAENARYILVLMLERKRVLAQTSWKETEDGKILFYENKKTGDVFMVRDPELRLDELASIQEEVAMQLGFGGPAAVAAKAVGIEIGPDGKVIPKAKPEKKSKKAKVKDPVVAEVPAPAEAQSDPQPQPAPETPTQPTVEEEVIFDATNE
jgi:hypothetical protein